MDRNAELIRLRAALTDIVAHGQAMIDSITAALALPTVPTVPTAVAAVAAPGTADTDAFRPASLKFNTEKSKEDRHAHGIYFTPRQIRAKLFEVLDSLQIAPTNILEPSFGSGEFLLDAATHYPGAHLWGVERDVAMYKALQTSGTLPSASLTNSDFLTYTAAPVDLILGNPPYFVTKAKNPACMTGRGNIYVQFVYKCLTEHLVPGGVLAFVLPTSFYNCSYYEPCRRYIRENTTVLRVENLDGGFYDTAQDTMLLVLRAASGSGALGALGALGTLGAKEQKYIFPYNGNVYLSPNYRELGALVAGARTLRDLGCSVKTGEVVWNQEKEKLHSTEGVVVLYASNIVNNAICLDNFKPSKAVPSAAAAAAAANTEKRQRIVGFKGTPVQGPAIVVCRGYGNAYSMQYAFVPEGMSFYGENHVNVITSPTATVFQRILASFADPRTNTFVQMFVGNGAMSKSELESVFPIFEVSV